MKLPSATQQFVVVLALCCLIALPRLVPSFVVSTETVDFRAYYNAVTAFADNADPYQAFAINGQPYTANESLGTQFVYSPALLVLLRPFAEVNFSALERGWLLLQILCGSLGLVLILRHTIKLHRENLHFLHLVAMTLLVLGPLYYNYATGQLDVILFPLLVAALLTIEKNPLHAGIYFAAFLFFKHNIIFIGIPLFFVGGLKFVRGFVFAFIALVVLFLPFIDWMTWESFFKMLFAGSESLVTLPPATDVFNLGVSGLLDRIELFYGPLSILLGLAIVFGICYIGKSVLRLNTESWFFPAFLCALLFLPRLWPHHIMLLMPIVVYVFVNDIDVKGVRRILAIAMLIWIFAIPGFILSKAFEKNGLWNRGEAFTSILTLCIIAIFIIRSFVTHSIKKRSHETSYV
ncbi:MAG: DUF2029 domain-containing protein [Ignavibacteria bacterium]|nr:DUF2029 domain-containing protein [Ignavibacteria bacterium]